MTHEQKSNRKNESKEWIVDALLELTGERATTAVVDEVFAHFCVGK